MFKVVMNPFGGKDEQKTQDAFVKFVGGTHRAEQLSKLWGNSYPGTTRGFERALTKREVFCMKAKNAGFTTEEVNAFFCL